MSFSEQDFLANLESGFVDRLKSSSRAFLPALLTNNRQQSRKVLTSLERQLVGCRSFQFSVAFVTTGGVASLINALDGLRTRGVRGKVLASQYQNFTQPEALRRLLNLSNIDLRISVDHNFHAKGYLFEHEHDCWSLIVGSSNLTADALSKNAEWNLHVSALADSTLLEQTRAEFDFEFNRGLPVTHEFINAYEKVYDVARSRRAFDEPFSFVPSAHGNLADAERSSAAPLVRPNRMQEEALSNLEVVRAENKQRALLVSATGTGKTFLSAFDSMAFGAKRLLFVVHRRNIAEAALESFRVVHGEQRTFGLYSGGVKELDKDYVFCTVQTLSKPENLKRFSPDHFDYIVIDETHRAGAASYQAVIDYFRPGFLLGMTATPERTDGYDVFSLFDHTIAYEIRLHQALEEEMLSPFHYYGVTDLAINGEVVEENTEFNSLTSDERVDRILEKAALYGTDTGEMRGLVFCSRTEECAELAEKFRARGVRAVALTGADSEEARVEAIRRLEANGEQQKLDYIFTVDIFNEGVDIPKVNQVIMLRPTQSAIIFVQQMGRGLRKTDGKEYLTIIDFIGNYANNYLVPIALYGDNSFNKDRIRKLLNGGSSTIPGTSTVNFDLISKKRIYEAIDTANLQRLKDLRKDYDLLKFQLGRAPMMMDFVEHGARDPYSYVKAQKSFFHFAERQDESLKGALSEHEKSLMEKFAKEINNGKRAEESLLLLKLVQDGEVDLEEFKQDYLDTYGLPVTDATIASAIAGLNLRFVRAKKSGKMLPVGEILDFWAIQQAAEKVVLHPSFHQSIQNEVFEKYLVDSANYSIATFNKGFSVEKARSGFILYKKYSRKDVFRILHWATNPVAQNVGGYILSEDGSNCPIFVTYHKSEGISESINYEDYFVNNSTFAWMSKSNRTLKSSDVRAIRNAPNTGMRIPLFIKKSDDEGADFYYVGDVRPKDESFQQTTIKNDKGKLLPVVKVEFEMDDPVEDSLFYYFTHDQE